MIGISFLTLNLAAAGGTVTYAEELAQALARVGTLEYRAFVPRTAPDAGGGLPSVVVREFPAARTRPGRLLGLTLAAAVPGYIRRGLRLGELDAIHFPVGVMLPMVEAPPAATTLHDLQHETFPEFFSRSQLAYRRRVYGATLRRSRIVIAISGYVRDSLVEHTGVDPARIRVITHGVDHSRFRPGAAPREDFLLYPANRWPHKNHDRLFEAFRLVRRERPSLRLVLTGGSDNGRSLPQGVETHGRVPVEELVELYQTAAAVVFPTLYEGFGMPALEAMACGCPLAVSRVGPLPELCGDAAVYFDPASVEDIARGIDEVLSRPPTGGLERAAPYSWDECARRHDDVYRELATGPATRDG
jgi:glycosyltransferase involved in cell wall biosynthesis